MNRNEVEKYKRKFPGCQVSLFPHCLEVTGSDGTLLVASDFGGDGLWRNREENGKLVAKYPHDTFIKEEDDPKDQVEKGRDPLPEENTRDYYREEKKKKK